MKHASAIGLFKLRLQVVTYSVEGNVNKDMLSTESEMNPCDWSVAYTAI